MLYISNWSVYRLRSGQDYTGACHKLRIFIDQHHTSHARNSHLCSAEMIYTRNMRPLAPSPKKKRKKQGKAQTHAPTCRHKTPHLKVGTKHGSTHRTADAQNQQQQHHHQTDNGCALRLYRRRLVEQLI